MKKIFGFLLAGFISVSVAFPQEKAEEFDVKAAMSYIKDLADDIMQGRRSGQPGGRMAEDYIASKFQEWGLEPAGDEGTYFQNFTIEHRNIQPGVRFQVITSREKREFIYRDDWRVASYSGSSAAKAEIVYAGFGIHAPEQDYDDYAGVEVRDKFVLFSTGSPQKLKDKAKDEIRISNRVKKAKELGAKGVLIFKSPSDTSRYFWVRLEKELYDPGFVILTVNEHLTDFVFKDLKTEQRYLSEQTAEGKSQSFPTGVMADIRVEAFFYEEQPTRNVLAMITGTDEDLKDEYVIVGAHMDHLGVYPTGEVMNGANDNASGTAVVMETARAMKMADYRPRRTVVFALWAGEEQGLYGSKYYCDNPRFPLEKTVANLNIDMVGHGSEKVRFLGASYAPKIWKWLEEHLDSQILDKVEMNQRIAIGGSSDHAPFLAKGIPGFFIDTDGYHFKYHQVRDEYDLIDPKMVEKTGDFIHGAVKSLASATGDFFSERRQERTYFKHRDIINFSPVPLDVLVDRFAGKDTDIDVQLAVIPADEELSGGDLRLQVMDAFLSLQDKIKESPGLVLHSPSSRIYRNSRKGKTTVIPGLGGFASFEDDLRYVPVMSQLGIRFVWSDGLPGFFEKDRLSQRGQNLLKSLEENSILLIASGITDAQTTTLLENAKKPLALLTERIPGEKVLQSLKEKESSLGLVFTKDEYPSAYFEKLKILKKQLDSENLMLVNEECLWSPEGQAMYLGLISLVLQETDDTFDFYDIFTGAFSRLLR